VGRRVRWKKDGGQKKEGGQEGRVDKRDQEQLQKVVDLGG
jgi:hypothetical protein